MCNFSANQLSIYKSIVADVTNFKAYFTFPERYSGITDYSTRVREAMRVFGLHGQSINDCDLLWLNCLLAISVFY